jgi:hypothetical protein
VAGVVGAVRVVNFTVADAERPAASVTVTTTDVLPADEREQLASEVSPLSDTAHPTGSPDQTNWRVPDPPDATVMNVTLEPTVADTELPTIWTDGRGSTTNRIGGDCAPNPSESLTSA